MSRPTTREELLYLSNENFEKLNEYIDDLPGSQREVSFKTDTMNRNIRDVLAHLHHWHLLLLRWYEIGMSGKKPIMPDEGYTWKTLPDFNRMVWEKYNQTELGTVRKLFKKSHDKIQHLIVKHSDEELFQKKRYPWTGSTSMGAYFIGSTSSHYDWALKLIKKGLR